MSTLKVEVYDSINDINENQWNYLIEQSELGSFFHRYEWLKAIEDGIGVEAKHIVVLNGGTLIGIFPNFITDIKKTPFKRLTSATPGFGGPIIATRGNEVLDLMFKNISEICGKNIISHSISTPNFGYVRYGQYFEKKRYQPNLGNCRFIIDLNKSWDDIKSNMDKNRRYNLKKGLSNDFEIDNQRINDANLKHFYEVYVKAMKRVGGVAYPFSFFNNLKNNVNERVKMFSMIVEEKQVGSYLYFLDEEQSSLHHFFSAIAESDFKYYPSELLHECAIKWGIENGYKKYDFGGTGANFDNGLFKFKEEFGGQVIPTLSWERGYSQLGWNLFKLGKYFYKKWRR